MTEKVEKRRSAIINVVYIIMIIAMVYLFVKYCFGVAAPFLISFFLAVAVQKPLKWLDKKTKNKCHTLLSILLVLFIVLVILGPVIIILTLIGKEIANFGSFLMGQLSDLPSFLATLEKEILGFLAFLPDSIYSSVSETIADFFGRMIENFDLSTIGLDAKAITTGLTSGLSGIYSVVKNVPSVILSIVIGIVAWIFFTKDYAKIVAFIKLQLPEKNKNVLSEMKQIFSKTVLKMMRAYGLIMLITFCELTLGFSVLRLFGVLKNNYIVIIAMAIAIFDILPVAGSGGILIPWAIISLILGNYKLTIGLVVMYALITVFRQYLEPKVVGTTLGVHPIVTLAGLYFGLKLFGVLGMFIVPITLMTLKAFNDAGRIHLYKTPERN